MCGRFAIAPTREDAWASVGDILGAHIESELTALKTRYNIAPTMQVPIILQDAVTREIHAINARWGFIPHWWSKDKLPTMTINARSEEMSSKPMWRQALKHSRCLIPATHWYEWGEMTPENSPHALTRPDGKGFMFAGLWSKWTPPHEGAQQIVSCAILTRAASESAAKVHDRMPVILRPEAWTRWLDPEIKDSEVVKEILAVSSALEVRSWKVSKLVNKAANQESGCLSPAQRILIAISANQNKTQT